MSDIVERLKGTGAERQRTTAHDTPDHYLHVVAKISNADGLLMTEAADEITSLRAKVERLEAALATARADALEEAARCAEEHWWMADIHWWMHATKKEVSAKSAQEIAAAIRALATQP